MKKGDIFYLTGTSFIAKRIVKEISTEKSQRVITHEVQSIFRTGDYKEGWWPPHGANPRSSKETFLLEKEAFFHTESDAFDKLIENLTFEARGAECKAAYQKERAEDYYWAAEFVKTHRKKL